MNLPESVILPESVNLPESMATPRLTLRLWRPTDGDALARAIEESLDHLRPWMSWAADEPLSPQARAELIRTFEENWLSGGGVVYGAFLDNTVVGGCGLHRRAALSTLEIGYWVHVDHLGKGLATEMAGALTGAAFAIDGVARVEIHHDRANVRSGAVPTPLGFTFAGEHPDAVMAPGEEGTDCTWVMLRADWASQR